LSTADRALAALDRFPPEERLAAAARRLAGARAGPLSSFDVGCELAPSPELLDGRLLELIAARALAGARGAVFTGEPEARILAALGLARVAARRGVPEAEALAALAGAARSSRALSRALEGVRVLDPCCGGGALLAAALAVSRGCGAEPVLLGFDVAPLAAEAARARLALLDARAEVALADALAASWPGADLVLSNPPFLRHEALARADKARAVRRSGLSRQADLSAHLASVALRHAPDVALVWPRALDTARSAAPLLSDGAARGGFAFRLRSRVAGSFAASVHTVLAVWSKGHPGRPVAEASVPLAELAPWEVAELARGAGSARSRISPVEGDKPSPCTGAGRGARGAVQVGDVCEVRFGMKSGCNGFFHLRPLGAGRFEGALAGEVALGEDDARPILASLKEAAAPEVACPARVLFRPELETARTRAYVARGEALGVAQRPTCAGRSPWWTVAPGRAPAPVLYPAKVGARAFAFLNAGRLWEDKKWHALFPREEMEPWLLAVVLGATPVRLAIDRAARQLTGMQAIADIDCRVLSAAPFPAPRALAPLRAALAACHAALARDPVTTDVAAMLARPAHEELDRLVGHALGLPAADLAAIRREMVERVAARLEHAAQVRAAVARAAG
jgi:SAM-dependent methyltransferase